MFADTTLRAPTGAPSRGNRRRSWATRDGRELGPAWQLSALRTLYGA
jgi:hypothetical protein